MKTKYGFLILLVFSLLMGITSQSFGAEKKTFINFGTTSSSSGYYVYCAAVSRAINEAVPEIQINTLESGGVVDNVRRMEKGQINLFLSNSTADYCAFHAVGQFEQFPPQKNIRLLWYFTAFDINWIVRKDSGMKFIEELNGKKFGPGGLGTSTEKITQEIFDLLNIKPIYHKGGMGDASEAFKDRRIVGVTKADIPPSPYISELTASFPVMVLGLKDDQIKKIQEEMPYYRPSTIPKGSYKGVDKDVLTVMGLMGVSCYESMDETIVYKMVKAMFEGEGRSYWESAFAPAARFDIIKNTIENAPIPIHPGAIKYYEEKGFKIPDSLRLTN